MFGGSNDQSGTVGFLVGIIVLVFAGITFSLMVDKRFRFSSGRISLEQSIADESHRLQDLRRQVEQDNERWKEYQSLQKQGPEFSVLQESLLSTTARLRELRESRVALDAAVTAERAALVDYRDRYRKQVRSVAAGEKIAELQVRGGKTYREVTIRRVTPAGMEIGHSQGISRLRLAELGDAWIERFQWDPEEEAHVLQQERKVAERHEKSLADSMERRREENPRKPVLSREKAGRLQVSKELAALRRDVTETKRHLERAEMEADRARAEAVTNRGKSVPGSLETWDEKAARMQSASEKFRARYVAARGRLATVAPDDALLREEPAR